MPCALAVAAAIDRRCRFRGGDGIVNGMARCDGAAWKACGRFGPIGPSDLIHSLTIHAEDLIAGGHFSLAGESEAQNIARWDGSSWTPLGAGIDGPVLVLTSTNDRLVAGGAFEHAGGVLVHSVASWNGTGWQTIGSGFARGGDIASVEALTVFRGDLIAGGDFDQAGELAVNHIARWNGTIWDTLGTGVDGEVEALAVRNDRLIAGGRFQHAGEVAASRIAEWDGAEWHPLGAGLTVGLEGFPSVSVSCLASFGSDLITGGAFQKAGGNFANCVARWDGSAWHAMGGTDLPVLSLLVFEGGLILGGGFDHAGVITAHRIVRWGP
jgi:hypothetical protein